MSGEDVNPILDEAYESLNDVLERRRDIDPDLANELERTIDSLENVQDKVENVEDRNEQYQDALDTLANDFEDAMESEIDDREALFEGLSDLRSDLDDLADVDETDTKDAADELDSQLNDSYDEDDPVYTSNDGCDDQGTNRRAFGLSMLSAFGLGALVYAAGNNQGRNNNVDAPPTDNGSDGNSPPQDGSDGDEDPDPNPDGSDGAPSDETNNYDSKEFWTPELENKVPFQYTGFVDEDSTIVEIGKKYRVSEYDDVAIIGRALTLDSNDIILDEEGENRGEDLALTWWNRDDIISDTGYEDLDDDIEGIMALTDWQRNVYEFSILDEDEYDFAVDKAKDETSYSIQDPADPMEYLTGGSV